MEWEEKEEEEKDGRLKGRRREKEEKMDAVNVERSKLG